MGRLVHHKREARLRVFRVHKEGCPAVHIVPQQPQTLICSVPGLNDDVVQFIPQEVFDHPFVLRFNLEEIRQNSHRCQTTLHRSRLKQPPHRFG